MRIDREIVETAVQDAHDAQATELFFFARHGLPLLARWGRHFSGQCYC